MHTRQVMAILSLRGLVILQHYKYKLWVLREAAVDSCNNDNGGYNIGSYNISGYTKVSCSNLYKQLYWEFGVSHNCVCIIF